jgi:hypothetical protein
VRDRRGFDHELRLSGTFLFFQMQKLRLEAQEIVNDMEERYNRVEQAVHHAERTGEKERLRARRAKEVRLVSQPQTLLCVREMPQPNFISSPTSKHVLCRRHPLQTQP